MRILSCWSVLALGLLLAPVLGSADDKPKRATPAQRKEFAADLATGRKAVKAKDYAAGIAAYEAALKIVPTSTSVLGELGWALFLAGKLEPAEDKTREALYESSSAKQIGALRYNLGRIAEAQGDKDAARRAYTESLAYRVNATVEKRLDAVGGPLVDIQSAEAYDSLQDAVNGIAGIWECGPATLGPAKGEQEGCVYTVEESEELKGGGLDEARIVRIEGTAGMGGSVDARSLIVRHGKRWHHMGVVADSWVPGLDYIQNQGEVDAFEVGDFLPELTGTEILVRSTNSNTDHDPGIEMTSSGEQKEWYLCGVNAGKATCLKVISAVEWKSSELGEDWSAGKTLDSSKWAIGIGVKDGKIVMAAAAGTKASSLSPAAQACQGAFTFAELLLKACASPTVAE